MNTQHLGGGETWLKAFCSLAEDRLSTWDQTEYKTKDRFLSLLVLISYTRKQCLMTLVASQAILSVFCAVRVFRVTLHRVQANLCQQLFLY
jgi:hypothetical protein